MYVYLIDFLSCFDGESPANRYPGWVEIECAEESGHPVVCNPAARSFSRTRESSRILPMLWFLDGYESSLSTLNSVMEFCFHPRDKRHDLDL